ncbi:MAG: hypothetical protein HQ513_10870 [Rhodospirillales bacterium]|nr:hypothetical protein [Rhodospirillales bacterium]
MIATVNGFLGRHATVFLAMSLFVGLIFPQLSKALRPLLSPSVVALLLLSLLQIDWLRVFYYFRRPLFLGTVLLWLLVISPIVMWMVLEGTDLPIGVKVALVLLAASPPTLSSPALSQMIGLDGALSLALLALGIIIMPFLLPVMSIELLDLQLSMGTFELMMRLGVLIGGSVLAVMIMQKFFGRARIEAHAGSINTAALLSLIIFAVAIMDGVAATFRDDPQHTLMVIAVAFAANIGFQALGSVLFFGSGRKVSLTVGFSSGNRNMGILLPALPAAIWPDTLLFIAVLQFPIYMLPWAQKRIYLRFLRLGVT